MTPIVKGPMSTEDILEMFSDPEIIEEMSLVVADWIATAQWLSELGVPENTEDNHPLPLKDRFILLMEQTNGKT